MLGLFFINQIIYCILSQGFYDRVNSRSLLYCVICVFLCFVISLILSAIIYIILIPFFQKYNDMRIEREYKKNIDFEYYIIYAIIFDLKGILDNDAKELYLKYCKLFEKGIVLN